MTTFQDIIEQINNLKSMQQYNTNKQNLTNSNGFGHGLSQLGMNLSQSTNPMLSKIGVGTQSFGNNLGALGAAKGLGNAGAMGGAAGALGKATPFLGGAMSGAQAAQDAKNGDYIGAGLNGISAGASFIPGIGTAVSMGASMLDSINKAVRSAQDKANAKAMQISAQEAQKSEQNNAQDTAQLQNQFANDSMKYANAMVQPSIPEGSLSHVNYDLGINTPNIIQTPQNSPSTIPKNEDSIEGVPTGGAAPINTNFIQNLFNKHNSVKPIQVIDDGNGGAVIDKDATNQLAQQQGLDAKQSLLEKIRQGLGEFKSGYDDNSMNGFADGDLVQKLSNDTQQPVIPQDGTLTGGAATTKKTIMNRIGEAAGTGRRLMANPWVQAGIAAAISKADGGDAGDMAQAAYKYGTAKAMSDQYYKQLHPDAKVMPVLNTYGVDDYKAEAMNKYNQGRTVISRRDLIKLQNPTMSDQDVEDLIYKAGINGDELVSIKGYESVEKAKNNTRKTNIQEDKNKWQRDQGQQKIGIQQQNANTNAGRLQETKNNNTKKAQQKDRDYNYKVQQNEQKKIEAELKRRGLL